MPAKSVADVRAAFRARERTVALVADGAALDQLETLRAELDAQRKVRTDSLEGNPAVRELLGQIATLEQQVRDGVVTLRFRAVGRNRFRQLMAEHPDPDPDGGPFDPATFPAALIAACSLAPVLTVDDVAALGDLITDGQWEQVWDACWAICREVDGVPFSVAASSPTRG